MGRSTKSITYLILIASIEPPRLYRGIKQLSNQIPQIQRSCNLYKNIIQVSVDHPSDT